MGNGNSILRHIGPGVSGHTPGPLGQLPSSGIGGGGSRLMKSTGVVEPVPVSQTTTVIQDS